jgi:glutamine amidotransferase-like uncharacterized protein
MNYLIPVFLIGAGLILTKNSKSDKNEIKTKEIKNSKINVAIFESHAVSEPAYLATLKFFKENTNKFNYKSTKASDIRKGALNGMDSVIFMGGSGGGQAKDLGEEGLEAVRTFVKEGGGYIGVCAGAYMALQQKKGTDTLKLAIVSGQHYGQGWQRGMGPAEIKVDDQTKVDLFYANGPLFEKVAVDGIKPFYVIGTYVDDYYKPSKGTNKGEMPGKPALIVSQYGKGRIFLYSPNPLLGAGVKNEKMFYDSLIWVSEKGNVSSNIKFKDIFKF